MRLDIIGSVASGKTTLAAHLSAQYQIPYYEKDNIVWMRTPSGDVRRSEEEREQLFAKILAQTDWIVEGSPRKILRESFDCCDYIILLDVPTIIRLYRAVKRWCRQRLGKETYNHPPTWDFLKWNIRWVLEYTRERTELIHKLSAYGRKYQCFRNSRQAEAFIKSVYGK
ncbi:MAG: DNA topology modulation protein FlaR [Lachnospiraceae bacterium]|nr:DNA topology modulation protein FlaR [Lachnospiraceae bacterium]